MMLSVGKSLDPNSHRYFSSWRWQQLSESAIHAWLILNSDEAAVLSLYVTLGVTEMHCDAKCNCSRLFDDIRIGQCPETKKKKKKDLFIDVAAVRGLRHPVSDAYFSKILGEIR